MPRAPLPNLLRMSKGAHGAFDEIVLGGLLLANGMPRWDDLLSPAEVKAIHAHLIDAQRQAHERERRGLPVKKQVYSRVTAN
jgi:quinohemoprotein ethanol dehydrogenase